MQVLYVDDDRVNNLVLVEGCRSVVGVQTETAANGAEALQPAQCRVPDLLVIDLHLPRTTGYALLPARRAGFEGCWTQAGDPHLTLPELARRSRPTRPATA